MALWSRQKKVDVPAELQPYYAGDSQSGSRAWPVWAARILGVLIIIFLIILFIHWVWHENHTGGKKSHNPGTSQQHKSPQTGSNGGSSQQGAGTNGSSSNGSGSNNQQAQPNGANSSQPPATPSLTNTGPGETVVLFVIVTVAGTILYQYRLRQKA